MNDEMTMEQVTATLNAHKWRGRDDWFFPCETQLVGIPNHETWQIHPADAKAIAAFLWHRLSTGGNWQPIATAPKDGTVLLLARPDQEPWIDEWINELDGYWMMCDQWQDPVEPTHWMLLPSRPGESK